MARNRWALPLISLSVVLFGCGTSRIYDYRVTNKDCNCLTYVVRDRKNGITYEFTATYSIKDEILTTIKLRVENRSRKILSFDQARVKISSERFPYQYNNKFIPFSPITIGPGRSRELTLVGRAEVQEKEEWRQVAGERMTVTINGIRLGDNEVHVEEVRFVPINPKLSDEMH